MAEDLLPAILRLPVDLNTAITHALSAVPASRWIQAAQELSERYRAPRATTSAPLVHNQLQALGYAALILPATYAQLRSALAATAARLPGWVPETLLDLGSGPGTGLWAATAQWPSLRVLTAWEREQSLIALGRELTRSSDSPALRGALWEQANLDALGRVSGQYDLVVLGHVLNELGPAEQAIVVAEAWRLTSGVLLVVEPGTPEGFLVVRGARDQLLAERASTVAPCAHDRPCPLENDWCHFPQRLWRPDYQRRARQAPSEWEESKYAYAAMARMAPDPIWGRVIREPVANKAYAEVLVSAREGVGRYRALKRHREAFRMVKDLRWGAALDEPPGEPVQ